MHILINIRCLCVNFYAQAVDCMFVKKGASVQSHMHGEKHKELKWHSYSQKLTTPQRCLSHTVISYDLHVHVVCIKSRTYHVYNTSLQLHKPSMCKNKLQNPWTFLPEPLIKTFLSAWLPVVTFACSYQGCSWREVTFLGVNFQDGISLFRCWKGWTNCNRPVKLLIKNS